jgi:hypothetical protein
MRTVAKIVAALGFLAMAGIILYAFIAGDFNAEGTWLLAHPWGQVSLVDLYVGFAIFSLWIIYREKSFLRSLVWVVLMVVLGNWTTALYVLVALFTSKGNWKRFWMGRRGMVQDPVE